jgi:predicted DNA-binding protein with PD1-like motif
MNMTAFKLIRPRECVMGRLTYGCDLLEELNRIAKELSVRLGRIEAIGAVQKACIGFYNQETRTYQFESFDKPLEITKLTANISLKDGIPFVHAHVTLSDASGSCVGGHLAPGTIVFACEFLIEAFDGPVFKRSLDDQTGLPLWSM